MNSVWRTFRRPDAAFGAETLVNPASLGNVFHGASNVIPTVVAGVPSGIGCGPEHTHLGRAGLNVFGSNDLDCGTHTGLTDLSERVHREPQTQRRLLALFEMNLAERLLEERLSPLDRVEIMA